MGIRRRFALCSAAAVLVAWSGAAPVLAHGRAASPSRRQGHVVVYGATWRGIVERSVDGGPWQELWRIPDATSGPALVWSLAASADGQTIYAGTYSGHVWRSTDSGQTWSRADNGEFGTNNAVQSLAIDPRDPRIVFGGTQYGLFKTVDGGASWSRLTNVLPEMSGVQVAVSGQDPDTVWTVGSDSYSGRHGLDDSADGGNSWAAATGAGAPDSNLWSGLAVSPADSATVYASDENGLYRTDYGGASWTRLGVVTTGIVHGGALAISPVDPARLYLNTYFMTQTLYVSGDAGATWGEAGGLAGGDAYTVVPDPTEALYAYASTPDGLYRSTDGGAHWNRWIAGPPMNKIAVVATDAAPPAPNQPGSLCGGGSQVLGPISVGSAPVALAVDLALGIAPTRSTAMAPSPLSTPCAVRPSVPCASPLRRLKRAGKR